MLFWERSSALGDAMLPFTFTQMGATANMSKQLVGDAVWSKFYQGQTVGDDVVCPMQLRRAIFSQLEHYNSLLTDKAVGKEKAVASELYRAATTKWTDDKLRHDPYAPH